MAERAQVKPEAKRENKASLPQKVCPSQSISSPVEQILFLQRTIGNQAVHKLIKSGTLQTKLTMDQPGDIYEQEADRVAEQVMRMPESQKDHIQRLTDPVNLNTVRNNAQACLLHLHGDETNALHVAKELYKTHCVNLAYIDHPGSRLINVDVPSRSGVTCRADPNRIFDNTAIDNQWGKWNSGRCLRDPIKSDAQAAVRDYRDNTLNPKIRQCRGQPITQGQVGGTGVIGNLPIAAFHNNAPGSPTASPTRSGSRCIEDLTIRSYLPNHCEAAATETDVSRTQGFANPNIIQGENVDNFYLVTDPRDFLTLKSSRNVVLQSLNAPQDGSLSVVLRSGRYINIEAQKRRRNLGVNQSLGAEAMAAFGVSELPCPAASQGQSSSGTGVQADTSQSASGVIQRTPGARIQRDITSADLPRQRTSDLDRFMRRVYDLQVMLWTSQGAAYVAGVPNADLVAVASRDVLPGRPTQLHRVIATSVQSLLADARQDLASAKAAHEPGVRDVTDIRLRSGYRSAPEQLTVWEQNYPQYYRDTRAHRRTLSGGEHGDEAALYLATYINQRVFSPGYSPHQQGQTIDLTYKQNNSWAEADSSASGISMWQSSWLFRWLQAHAAQYGFVPNPNINEPWHWEYHPTMALLISFFQWLRELVQRIMHSLHRLFVGEEAQGTPSGEHAPHSTEPGAR